MDPHRISTWRRAAVLAAYLLATTAFAAEPLAVFECRELIGRDWDRTLITYYIDGGVDAPDRGMAPDEQSPAYVSISQPFRGDDVRLVDANGNEHAFQLWRVARRPDGMIGSARLSFMADLPAGGKYRFSLVPGLPRAAPDAPSATARPGPHRSETLELDSGVTALRLPASGNHAFETPLALATDHAAAVAALAGPRAQSVPSGPFLGVRLADGRWVGGSYFATEPTAAVMHRQGFIDRPPSDEQVRAALARSPRITGYSCRVTEQGPLFVEAGARFSFEGGGYYQFTARLLAGDPAIRIDEAMDIKQPCPAADPVYLVLLLNRDATPRPTRRIFRRAAQHIPAPWRPDTCFVMTTRRSDKHPPFETAIEKLGLASSFASLPITYETGGAVTALVPHDPWSDRAHYFGLVNSRDLLRTGRTSNAEHPTSNVALAEPTAINHQPSTILHQPSATNAPFVAIVPQHAGSWRGAHWVFPPKKPHMFNELMAYTNELVGLRWNLRAQPHPQNVLHTGEFDPGFSLTGMRRLWCLVGGPFQYHDGLGRLRAGQGYVNLDDYKDWILSWSEETQSVAGIPTPESLLRGQSNPYWHMAMSFKGGDDASYGWFSHYRQAQFMSWASDLEEQLESGALAGEAAALQRRGLAAFCQLMSEPDFNTRASGTHQGNPNMPINRFFALPYAARLIPGHPLARQWMDTTVEYLNYKLGMNVAPGGAWSELISYFQASQPTLVNAALVARRAGHIGDVTARLATAPVEFALRLLSPPDPRFGARIVPGFGHEGALCANIWTPAAGLMRTIDRDLASMLVWGWDQQGRPERADHDDGFAERTLSQADLLDRVTPELVSEYMGSTWYPGVGAVLRNHAGRSNETYFAMRQGYMASHSDANQGDFVLHAKGAPLTTMSLFGYAIHQQQPLIDLNTTFGWHSRVRFGEQSNTGGWPGGGAVSGIHRHFFSAPTDYLRAVGDYGPQRWTRQVLFIKGIAADGPNYLVMRDSALPLSGDRSELEQKWWYQRTLGTTDQVQATTNGFEYTSDFGQRMLVRFLQPNPVTIESRDAEGHGTLYHALGSNWRKAHGDDSGGSNIAVTERITVNAAGPIEAGQDVMVVIVPLAAGEKPPQVDALGDGAARIKTTEGTDYVFLSHFGLRFKSGPVNFEGIAGTVRVQQDDVHLAIVEGGGHASYRDAVLTAGKPVSKTVTFAAANEGVSLEEPGYDFTISSGFDPSAGTIENPAPGVRLQTLGDRFVYSFRSEETIRITPLALRAPMRTTRGRPASHTVDFIGKRGEIIIDRKDGTVRLILLDGSRIGYDGLVADVASPPYEITYHADRIEGITEGPARLIHLTMPKGLVQLPTVAIDGTSYAPGTHENTLIIPVSEGRSQFAVTNLEQPGVFRAWQRW